MLKHAAAYGLDTASRGVPSAAATADQEPVVRFENVEKSYDGREMVIEALNLDIHRGEFLTLLGPSGSGKTTTLMMLAGFEAPTRGSILFEGRNVNDIPPHKRELGVVFQNYALFPHLTVAGNLAYPLRVRRASKQEIERRVGKALDMVHLSTFGERKPSQLSGGQQQRVALARALIFEPALVLMDEPLGALDKQLREQLQIEIKHIQNSLGVTTVYVTHDQSEALAMSDRIAVFNEGRIEQLDKPRLLYEEPATAFVAQFIGQNNRLRGSIRQIDGEFCQVEVEGHGNVRAKRIGDVGIGAPVTLSIRPERIGIATEDDGFDNTADATLVEAVYFGDFSHINVRAFGQEEFVLKVPAGEVEDAIGPDRPLKVGFNAAHCRALRPEE